MSKIDDLLNGFKERFSNPFVLSFIISWLIWNWEVSIALLWYDTDQLADKETIFSFVESNLSWRKSLIYPLIFALIYTIIWPFFSSSISLFLTWVDKKREELSIRILKNSKVSMDKYLVMRDILESRSKILEEVISSESVNLIELEKVKTENTNLKNDLNQKQSNITEINEKLISVESEVEGLRNLKVKTDELEKELSGKDVEINNLKDFQSKVRDVSVLNGKWENRHESSDGLTGKEFAIIKDGKYFITNNKFDVPAKHEYEIKKFFHDMNTNEISFIKERIADSMMKSKPKRYLNFLDASNGLKLLTGVENSNMTIQYIRKSRVTK